MKRDRLTWYIYSMITLLLACIIYRENGIVDWLMLSVSCASFLWASRPAR